MSYNGIGLLTPRGSGTSGHVESNLASKKSFKHSNNYQKRVAEAHRKEKYERNVADKLARKDSSKEIQDHTAKRSIEVKCMELREKLEDQDLDDQEIDKRVKELRDTLKGNAATKGSKVNVTAQDKEHINKAPDRKDELDKDKGPEKTASYGYRARYSDERGRHRRD